MIWLRKFLTPGNPDFTHSFFHTCASFCSFFGTDVFKWPVIQMAQAIELSTLRKYRKEEVIRSKTRKKQREDSDGFHLV